MVSLTVSLKGAPKVLLDFPSKSLDQITVEEVKNAVHRKISKFEPRRQRLQYPQGKSKPLALTDEKKSLASYGVKEGDEIRLKDLGRQTDYRNLYLWEYSGVIFLNPLFLKYSHLLWGNYTPSSLQLTIRTLIVIHFVKRFLESAFLHTFSRPSVPVSYVLRNIAYYWGIVGLLCGITLYRPAYSAEALKGSILNNPAWITFWTVFILAAEVLNFNAHYHLSTLRRPAGQPRVYPTGLGFGTAVCANYWFEALSVLGMLVMTGFDLGTFVYLLIGFYFMYIWANGKYARYKKEFDPKVYPGKRWKWLPPIF